MARRKDSPRDLVLLSAFAQDGAPIEELRLTIEEYYEGGVELIDSAEYRQQKNIRVVKGSIYDQKGKLIQTYEVHYNEQGHLTKDRAVHADGTVTSHGWPDA